MKRGTKQKVPEDDTKDGHKESSKDKDNQKDVKDSKANEKDKDKKDNHKDKDEKDKSKKGKKDKTHKKKPSSSEHPLSNDDKKDKTDKPRKSNKKELVGAETQKQFDDNAKKVKLQKGEKAFYLETRLHEYTATVQLPIVTSYFELLSVITRILEIYRTVARPFAADYQLKYSITKDSWHLLAQSDFDKLPDRGAKVRVEKVATPQLVHLPEYKREKNQYIGINLKSAKDLVSSILRHCRPFVVIFSVAQKDLKFKSQITKKATTDPFFGENFVIPIPSNTVKNGRIADTLVVTVFNYQKGSQPSVLGKAKFPLSVLERDHARSAIAKLDHGGFIDLEMKWFEDSKIYASPKDETKQYRLATSSGNVFFTPPPTRSKHGVKKDLKTESLWFGQLTTVSAQNLRAGDILVQKAYDDNDLYDEVVQSQKRYAASQATMRSCHALLITKDGGSEIVHVGHNGIETITSLPNFNYLVYRCKVQEHAKEAVTWAIATASKTPPIKYNASNCFNEAHTKEVVDKKAMHKPPADLPTEMISSEFVVYAYQQPKDLTPINIPGVTAFPMKLEDYLNTHLASTFSFIGAIQQAISEVPAVTTSSSKKKDKALKRDKTKGGTTPATTEAPPEEPQLPPGPNPYPVFGLSVEELWKKNEGVPYFWRLLFDFLSEESFTGTEGILRVPGSADEAIYYKQLFDLGRDVTFKCSCHDAVGLLKMYLRELPEQIIPQIFDQQIPLIIASYEPDSLDLATEIKFVINSLPEPNRVFFSMLMSLLYKIVQKEPQNKMTVENVIRCIVPTLKCGPQIVLFGLNHFQFIFGDVAAPPEAPAESAAAQPTPNNVRRPPAWAVREKKADSDESKKEGTPSRVPAPRLPRSPEQPTREALSARSAKESLSPKESGEMPPLPSTGGESTSTEKPPKTHRRNRDTLVFYDLKPNSPILESVETESGDSYQTESSDSHSTESGSEESSSALDTGESFSGSG